MTRMIHPIIITLLLSVVCVFADYLLKRASMCVNPYRSGWFALALTLEASAAFGWIYVMRHMKLSVIGAVYSVSIVLLLTALGVFVFRETVTIRDIVGIMCAIAALILLGRFI